MKWFLAERPANLLGGDAGNRDAFLTAAIAAHDLNGPFGEVQGVREVCDQGLVGGAFDGRGGHADHQRVISGAGAFGLSRARDDADVDFNARAGLTNQGKPFDPSAASGSPGAGRGAARSRQALSAARRDLVGLAEYLVDGEPRPVEQDLVLALARFLLPHVLERVLQR